MKHHQPALLMRVTPLVMAALLAPLSVRVYAQSTDDSNSYAASSTFWLQNFQRGLANAPKAEATNTPAANSSGQESNSTTDMILDAAGAALGTAWTATKSFYDRNKPEIEHTAIGVAGAAATYWIGHEINTTGQAPPPAQSQPGQ